MSATSNESTSDPRDVAAALRRELDTEESWMRSSGTSDQQERPEAGDLVSWMLRAARLAAVGDGTPFAAWPQLASILNVDVIDAITKTAISSTKTLEESGGHALGEAIGDAEDASCLRSVEPGLTGLLAAVFPILDLWIDAAEECPLDDDAIDLVHARRETWDLGEAERLAVVRTPLHELDLQVTAGLNGGVQRLAPVFELAEDLALFADGKPSKRMLAQFNARKGQGVTPGGLDIIVEPILDEWWDVFVRIKGTAAKFVRQVRLGTLLLERLEDDAALWTVSLKNLPLDPLTRLVGSDIAIKTTDGGRFLI
jgi:hypothetical protein